MTECNRDTVSVLKVSVSRRSRDVFWLSRPRLGLGLWRLMNIPGVQIQQSAFICVHSCVSSTFYETNMNKWIITVLAEHLLLASYPPTPPHYPSAPASYIKETLPLVVWYSLQPAFWCIIPQENLLICTIKTVVTAHDHSKVSAVCSRGT